MSLINKTGIRALAKSLDMKISADSFDAAEARLEAIIKRAAEKAKKKRRKTILKRDIEHELNLFDL